MQDPSMSLKTLFLDLECDALLYDVSKIWCAVGYDPDLDKYLIHHDDEYYQEVTHPKNCIYYPDFSIFLHDLKKYDTIVAHNLLGYDRLVIEKLYKYTIPIDKCTDTFVMSSVQYPDRDGHSLEYYGDKFRYPKGDHSDWSKFTPAMLTYCIRDVDLLVKVHRYLVEEQDGWDWSLALKIEHSIADIMARQEWYGVLFDTDKAEKLVEKISEEIKEIENRALSEIPKKAIMVGAEVMKPFKKDGKLTKQVMDWVEE